jgi:hypothetical protein
MACLVVLTVLLSALTTVWYSRERNLMDDATRVVDTREWWDLTRYPDTGRPYTWLSQTRLFCWSGGQVFEDPFLYDTATRRETPLSALEDLMDVPNTYVDSWELSPDGMWILWTNKLLQPLHAARLDGSQHHVWHLPSKPHESWIWNGWIDDSRHWVASRGPGELAYVGDVAKPDHAIPISSVDAERLLCEAIDLDTRGNPQVHLAGSDVAPKRLRQSRPFHTVLLHPPPGAEIADAGYQIVSDSSGHRLAWLLDATRASRLLAWLHHWVGAIPARPYRRTELWVSRPDGTGLREIGYVPLPPSASTDYDAGVAYAPRLPAWLPDGKHVSFLYENTLWTIPVD